MSINTDALLRKELDELRELHKQAQHATELAQKATEETHKAHDQLSRAQQQRDLDKDKIAALELTIQTASIMSFNSPVPNTNLLQTINAAVPIDEHRLNDALNGISREFDGRLNDLHTILTNDADAREDRLLQNITALIASSINTNILPNVAPVSTVPQNISFNLAASTTNL